MTFAPETTSMSASSWCAYRTSPCFVAQPVKASKTESGPVSAGSTSASVMAGPSCPAGTATRHLARGPGREDLQDLLTVLGQFVLADAADPGQVGQPRQPPKLLLR